MIQCPYCSAEMGDEAASCPKCLSLLIESGEERKSFPLPRLLHPRVAMVFVSVLAVGLIGLVYRTRIETWIFHSPGKTSLRAGPAAGDTASVAPGSEKTSAGPAAADQSKEELYNQIAEYENAVLELLKQADGLAQDLDKFRSSNDKKNVAPMGQKLSEFQGLLSKIRSLTPVAPLARTHTSLSNSFALRQRGYREMMVYLQSGDLARLNSGQNDLSTADKYRKQALDDIKRIKERYAPPPAPTPTPQPAATAAETPAPGPEPTAPKPGATAAEPAAGATAKEGQTTEPAPGATATVQPADSVSPTPALPLPGLTLEPTPP